MQNSSEQAESHRFLTVTDEAISVTAQTEIHASLNAIIPERKRNLPLPKPISLDDFVSLMTAPRLLAPSGAFEYGGNARLPKAKSQNQLEPTPRRPIGSYGSNCNLYSWKDNTVGPVNLASGYGSNTFPYSAAHVLDPNTMPNKTHVVTDTRKCEPDASDSFSVPRKISHFTGSTSHVLTEINKDVSKIPSCTSSTLAVTQNKKDTSPNPTLFTP